MRRGLFSAAALIAIAFGASGCQGPPQPTGPTDILLHIPDREAFLDAALTVLREQHLPPQRVDRRAGLIVSRPTTSGQWFEFWRADSPGAYQLLESSMHTVRRIVTVRLEPSRPGARADEYRLAVEVAKQRHSAPERQVTTASGALAIYSEHLPTTEGLRAAKGAGAHWVPLGRDVLLESYLLDKLARRLPEVRPVTELVPAAETQPAPGAG